MVNSLQKAIRERPLHARTIPLNQARHATPTMDTQIDITSASMDHAEGTLVSLPGAETNIDPNTDADIDHAADEGSGMADSSGMSQTGPSKKPMKRMTLNDAQKYEVCVYMKEEEGKASRLTNKALVTYILERFAIKVDESTVSRLRQQSTSRLSCNVSNPARKRNRDVAFPELERLLGDFVLTMKRKSVISDPMIINRGKELRSQLGIPEEQMKFSDGWLNKFKVRHGLKSQSISKTPRTNNGISKRRIKNNRLPTDRTDQAGTIVAIATQGTSLDLSIDSPLQPSLHSTGSNLSHDDHLEVDMDLGAAIDSEGSQSLHMDQVLRQQLASHANGINNTTTSVVESTVIPMDLLPSVYGNTLGATSAAPPEHPRQQTPQLITSKNTRAPHKTTGSRSGGSRTPQLNLTESLAGLELTSTAVTAASQLVSGTSPSGDGGISGSRSTVPVTAARASLSMRMADPIAAAFQPEPPVDFDEASQCVDTLRVFMQQQNFSHEQLEHLKEIYLTLDMKRKQQQL